MRLRSVGRPDQRGSTLAFAAVALTALVSVGALAVDLGMLYKARADALHAAEAGALAGASAFVEIHDRDDAEDEAEDRAVEFATANRILGSPIAAEEVSVEVLPGQKVRVTVDRDGIGTWFGRLLGTQSSDVQARAAALVEEGDDVSCVQRLMIPDMWDERSGEDLDGDDLEDSNEDWEFRGDRDRYNPNQHGFGTNFRNGRPDQSGIRYTADFGRRMTLNPVTTTSGNGDRGLNSYDFWTFDDEPVTESELVQAFQDCGDETVNLDDEFEVYRPRDWTSARNTIRQILRNRISADGSTRWNQSTQSMQSSLPDWRSSPRVIKVALYNPEQMEDWGSGNEEANFNNVALFFLESVDNSNNITGRFLYYVTGNGTGDDDEDGGSLVKHVRLVE